MNILVLLLLLLCSSAAAQNGWIARYHPLPNAKKIPVRACQENLNGYLCPHGRVLVRRTADAQTQVRLELFGKQFSVRFAPMPYHLWGAWNTDLNRDSKADLIVKFNWGGNGILWDSNITVFALSSPSGYRLTAINNMMFDPDALVFWRGKPVVLQTTLIGATSSRTGRRHNFWVYFPIQVRGTRLTAVDAPFWVQYTFGKNHRPTNKLKRQDKTAALKELGMQRFEPLL
jgi:hypothetical protein